MAKFFQHGSVCLLLFLRTFGCPGMEKARAASGRSEGGDDGDDADIDDQDVFSKQWRLY